MALVTLSTLRTSARRKADMVGSTFVSDSELTEYINKSIAELYDILVSAYGEDYFVASATFTGTGAESYLLTAAPISISNFYKLKGLDVNDGGSWVSLRSFQFSERNRRENVGAGNVADDYRYRIAGDRLYFEINNPPPTGMQFKLWYIPTPTALSADGDTFDGKNSWEEYVTLDVGIKCLIKEESDTSALAAQKQACLRRITEMAANRDVGEPHRVIDIHATRDREDFWY